MVQRFVVGDEVAVSAKVLKKLDLSRAKVSLPNYNFPFWILAPGAKVGQSIELTGEVTHVDHEGGKVTVNLGSLATLDAGAVRLVKQRQPQRRAPRHNKPD